MPGNATANHRLGSIVPELPEVECLRRSLEPHVVGATIASVEIRRGDVISSRSGRRTRTPTRATKAMRASLMEGMRVRAVNRRGKQMALITDSGAGVVVHLGMSGRLMLTRPGEVQPVHTHVLWTFTRPRAEFPGMRFTDPRRFGYLLPFAGPAALEQIWEPIGPDALALKAGPARATVADAIRSTRRAIKPLLLDQGVVAGVGNIYADEACFAARLDPHRPGNSLRDSDIARLLNVVPTVMRQAIECGGTTLRDYADAMGARGSAQAKHAVYGRAGKACVLCGSVLASDRLGQRATVWCPVCQG